MRSAIAIYKSLQVFNNVLCVAFLSLIKIQITDLFDFYLLRKNQDLMQNCTYMLIPVSCYLRCVLGRLQKQVKTKTR